MRKWQLLHWPVAGKRIDIEWLFEPRDWWIGVFFDERNGDEGKPWMAADRFRHVYICLIPCFPVHVWWFVKRQETAA